MPPEPVGFAAEPSHILVTCDLESLYHITPRFPSAEDQDGGFGIDDLRHSLLLELAAVKQLSTEAAIGDVRHARRTTHGSEDDIVVRPSFLDTESFSTARCATCELES